MNYTQPSGLYPIKRHSVQFNLINSTALNSVPFDLLIGIPTLTFGIVPLMILFSGDVIVPNTNPIFIGNPLLLAPNNQRCFSQFSVDVGTNVTVNLMLGMQNDNQFSAVAFPNAIRDYNPSNTTPGTNVLSVWQQIDEVGASWGGRFTIYYLDQPLYT